MKKFILGMALCIGIASCGNRNGEKYKVQEVALAPSPNAEPAMAADVKANSTESAQAGNAGGQPGAVTPTEKKVVKEGEISLETGDLKASRKSLTDSLKKLGGYIDEESENTDTYEGRKNYVFKARIPVQNFERFLNTVSASADHVESKSIRIKDVTTEYIDITTRLNNKKLLENRYKALLAKAGKMSDILEVENKLNDIRTDIESSQGQLNYLNKQIAFSTLQITFFTKNSAGNNSGNSFGYKLKNAFGESLQVLQSIFFGVITFWPVIALVAIIYFIFRQWRKRKSRKATL
ncbi:DUF4349 domain-containing protein [Mucilaginibacter terrae]|uniref:DUF4349 domain-containing protein n=1 Tax=Mucilaginibacter terrae TaxID=1955052 RepID=UPI003630793C